MLYRKDKSMSELSVWTVRTLSIFRFLVITLLSFFLLSPFLKSINRTVEKPVIILAQDNSESIIVGKDSSFSRTEYKKNLQSMIDELNEKYEVRTYSFADKTKEIKSVDSLRFNEKQTNISMFLMT